MPYISPTTNPAEALTNLGSMMFPDPARMAQAQYQGAHARKTEAETSALNSQNIARNAVGQALSAAVANPNQDTIGNAVATALQAGYDPAQVVRGALAAHQAAGAPGGPQMARSLADTVSSMVGGTPYANTQSGFEQGQANDIRRAQIGIMPGMAQVGLARDVANNNRIFVDQNGNRQVVPMGQPIPNGMMPEDTSRALGVANIGVQPSLMQQQRENIQYQDTPQPYVNPGNGQTFNRQPGGPLPPQGFLPSQQGAPVLSSQIAAAPAMTTANAPRPFAVPDPTSRTGTGITYARPNEGFPQNGVPVDPQNPIQTGIGVGMFGATPPGDPGVSSGGVTVRSTLGNLIAPSGGLPTAPASALPLAQADGAAQASARPPDQFDNLAATATGPGMNGQQDKPVDDKTINTAIDRRVEEYNAQKNSGMANAATKDFQLSGDARSAIIQRVAQLQRTRGPTFGNFTAALQQAWSELEPQFQRNARVARMPTGPSLLTLPPAPRQGGATGPVPSAGLPNSAPAHTGESPTHLEPVPAPGNLPRTGNSAPTLSSVFASPETLGVGGAQVAQAAPQPTQQASAPPAPANPGARAVGAIYTTPNGQQLMWTGQGWTR